VDDPGAGPSVPATAVMRDALAALLDGGTGWVAVTDPKTGKPLGVLTATDIAEVASATRDQSATSRRSAGSR
jgi:CBS domain-containing protein